jgi:hypothetical protein
MNLLNFFGSFFEALRPFSKNYLTTYEATKIVFHPLAANFYFSFEEKNQPG